MSRHIAIFDTTLRDGEQAPGCSMNLSEKLEVAHRLERLKVDVIEAGFPVSSKGDFEAVRAIAAKVKECSIAGLTRAVFSDIDTTWDAIRNAVQPRIHVFLSTSPIHMEYKLRMTPEQVLDRLVESVRYAKSKCADVEFSAEDAMRSDMDFLCRVVEQAIAAGATVVNVPDTVGYLMPDEITARITELMNRVPNIDKAVLSVHCHNDLGLANANALAGVMAGAGQVECTINGIGERAGNTALEEFVMALKTRQDFFDCDTRIDTTKIYKASKLLYNIIGNSIPLNKPIVGKNAFKHESGIHQHGVLADRRTYEILTPESVGVKQNEMVLGKHSGRHAFAQRLTELGIELTKEELDEAFAEFKKLCDKKSVVTDSDVEALVAHRKVDFNDYVLDSFNVHSGNDANSVAVMRMHKDDKKYEEVALGDGPVAAAYKAIDRIMKPKPHSLEKYTIHAVSEGRDTLGEAIVKLRFGEETVNGRGLSTDIIEASIRAYINALNKMTIEFSGETEE